MIMKKILIVNNNMQVGGVQKSLCNLLWAIHDRYEVTLYLFSSWGEYRNDIPGDVRVIECGGPFRFLGVSQHQCTGLDKLKRGALVLLCRVFGRRTVLRMLLPLEKCVEGQYDCAIAFLQNGNHRNFYGGVQDFVLGKVKADRKIAFLHCDYGNCGADHPDNNRLIAEFDQIAACSDGCREAFAAVLPEMAEKTVTVRNFHRYEQVRALADQEPEEYDPTVQNVVMVSRLSHEKGIERAIRAVARAVEQGIPVMLHIVGGGPMRDMLEKTAEELGICSCVRFYGEQANPYRYMKNADLFVMSSFHEAAPMVIDEALCLNVPVLTVQTTSSYEMVTLRQGGWVCENTEEALSQTLIRVLPDTKGIDTVRNILRGQYNNNNAAAAQFAELFEG